MMWYTGSSGGTDSFVVVDTDCVLDGGTLSAASSIIGAACACVFAALLAVGPRCGVERCPQGAACTWSRVREAQDRSPALRTGTTPLLPLLSTYAESSAVMAHRIPLGAVVSRPVPFPRELYQLHTP